MQQRLRADALAVLLNEGLSYCVHHLKTGWVSYLRSRLQYQTRVWECVNTMLALVICLLTYFGTLLRCSSMACHLLALQRQQLLAAS